MEQKEYEERVQALQQRVAELEDTVAFLQKGNADLIARNLQLGQQIDAYYDVRRRVQIYKELFARHTDFLQHVDLRDDEELMAIIETRLEEENSFQDPDFGLKELAVMLGASQTRIIDLFRRSSLYKTLDDYLDYLRLLRSMYYLKERGEWSIAACAQEAGFTSIRSFNRKFQDAIGMTPREFRDLVDSQSA